MRHILLLFSLGVYINSSWAVNIYMKGPPGLRGGSVIHPSSKFFPSFGQKTRRTFSPFPMIQARAPSFRSYSRYGPSLRTISTRTYRPSRRVYGERRPSLGSPYGPSIRRPVFRVRQGSPLSRSYRRNGRVMSERVISPEYFRSRTGSRSTIGRVPSFGRRVPQGVLSGRRIRLRQSSRRPSSASRRPDEEIIALFAVDDARNQGSILPPGLSRPRMSETMDKGVKAEKIVAATIETKTKTEDKIQVTKEIEQAKTETANSVQIADIEMANSVQKTDVDTANSVQNTDAEATIVVKDADTVNITVDVTKIAAPTGNIKPVGQKDIVVEGAVVKGAVVKGAIVKDTIVKDAVAQAVTDTQVGVISLGESPVTIHKPEVTQKDQTLIVTKQDIPQVKAAEVPMKH